MPISLSHNSTHKKKNKIKNHQRRSQNRKIKRKQVLLLRNTNTNFSKRCTKYNNQETLTDVDTLADEILKLAKNTGFIKRDVGFDPIIFIESILETLAIPSVKSINLIRKHYRQKMQKVREINAKMGEKPFWNRLASKECLNFVRGVLNLIENIHNRTVEQYKYNEGVELISLLNKYGLKIEDIIIIDGTYWKVDSSLNEVYPGTRTNSNDIKLNNVYTEHGEECFKKIQSAGIGLQTQMSLKSGSVKSMVLTPETADEKKYIDLEKRQKVLMLMDSGYYSNEIVKYFNSNPEKFFLTKGRRNCAATIIECMIWNGTKFCKHKNCKYIGMKVSQALNLALKNNENLDLIVTLANGEKARMVAFKTKDSKTNDDEIVLLVTNIEQNVLSPKMITNLYRVRWQCELLFKNLKSGCTLKFSNVSKNTNIIKIFVIASLITYFIKNIPGLVLSRSLKNISFWKIHVESIWFNDYLSAFMNNDVDTLKKILNFLYENEDFVVKDRQSRRKSLEFRTFRSVLDDMRQTFEESVIQDNIAA